MAFVSAMVDIVFPFRKMSTKPDQAQESPRTTKLHDRTADKVTVEDIEKIGI